MDPPNYIIVQKAQSMHTQYNQFGTGARWHTPKEQLLRVCVWEGGISVLNIKLLVGIMGEHVLYEQCWYKK
jgi:hypothetical protein